MLFCPQCANLLLVQNDGGQMFYCQSCPYQYSISNKLTTRKLLERKEVDDVLGGAKAWENVNSTEGLFINTYIKDKVIECYSFIYLNNHKKIYIFLLLLYFISNLSKV
ncbi:unnamed protein product [Cunninghamella echinulata]